MLLIVILENIVKGVGSVFSVPMENIVLMRVALIAQIALLGHIQLRVLLAVNLATLDSSHSLVVLLHSVFRAMTSFSI